MKETMTAQEALTRLRAGNETYLSAVTNPGDISARLRGVTAEYGQHPYAVIVACADSRVVPEHIFGAGLGELFVIRAAGNVIGDHELGSIEYGAEHLGCRLVVILGHTGCGAVDAALNSEPEGYVRCLTDAIRENIGGVTDPTQASCLNAQAGAQTVRGLIHVPGLEVVGALYHIDTGAVEFL